MAKKAVATFSGDRSKSKTVVKCIRMVKSERTGSYAFEEELVPNEKVKDFFNKK
ncbi:MAG: DUF4295 domain-containing protein [Bacteroidales bacterium]|nr:DUF4295 domain-containing protein [Bacteroidales bacterium]